LSLLAGLDWLAADDATSRSMTTTVTLRSRRRITLPAPIAAAAGLRPGDALNVEWAGGRIVLTPIPAASQTRQPMSRFLGAARGVYGDSAEEADNELRCQRASW
jgi:AbrB family looped-hinge helix DNA binding protein